VIAGNISLARPKNTTPGGDGEQAVFIDSGRIGAPENLLPPLPRNLKGACGRMAFERDCDIGGHNGAAARPDLVNCKPGLGFS